LIGKKHIEKRRKTKMKSDNLNGPGNITKGLGIDDTFDGYNLLTGIIDLSPRIHPLDQAIARPRKNAKRNDKNLWRFTLIIK